MHTLKEFKRMLWEGIKENTSERNKSFLKSTICAESKGTVTVGNSWKENS